MKKLAGLLAGISLLALTGHMAKADTFVYNTASVPIGDNLTLSGTVNGQTVSPFGASVGQIDLVGSRNGGPTMTLPAWCLDIFHELMSPGTFNIVPITTAGSGFPNPTLSTTQIQQIGALIVEGNMAIANNTEGLFDGSNADGSAAFQLAIWNVEYQGELLTNADGALAAIVTQLVANVGTGGIWANVGSTVDLLDAAPSNQVLAFAAPTPLPATAWMFAGGLGLIGMLSRRRRKSASTSAFAAA